MSFGLSSGGGQVRYAVVFDSTQAESNVKRYQTSLQQLATGTTGVSGKMAIMNNTFTAGVTPIKNQGNALNQLATTQKTIGSQLGGLGSAFKNNALAIGAAASSVLGLYQNYANLSSAQNAANKSSTAAKAAQNNLTKAQDTLNKAIDKYGTGSKQAIDAQNKLTVAQERAVNKTESAKIAQDNLNQTMADFGINILPNVLLAGGSITSIFDNINLKGKSLTGIVSKLGGIFSGIIPSLTGIGKQGTVASGALSTLGTSATGAGSGLKGLVGTLGPLAFALGGAVGIYEEFNAQLKINQQVASGVIKPIEGVTKTLDQMAHLDWSSIEGAIVSIAKLTGGSAAYADLIKKIAAGDITKLSKQTTDLSKAEEKLAADQQKLIDLGKQRQTTGVKQQEAELKITIDQDKAEIARLKTLGTTATAIDKVTQSTQAELNVISRRNQAMVEAQKADIDIAAALGEVISKTTAAADGAKRMAEEVKLENDAMKNILPNIVKQAESLKTTAEATKLVGDMVKLTKDRMIEWNPAAGASADIMSTIDGVLAGLPAKQASWTNSITANAKALEDAKKKLEDFKKGLESAQTNIKGVFKIDSNADKILKNLIKALPNKAEKEIKLKLKFGQSIDDNKKAFNDLLFEATQVSDKTADASAKQIIETIDKKFKGSKGQFAGLRAALEAAIADPNTPEKLKQLLMSFNWDSIGVKINKDIQTGVNKTPLTVEVKATLAGFLNSGKSRFSNTPGGNSILASLGLKPEDLKITIPPPDISKVSPELQKVSAIQVPPPNETKYQQGLQLAIANAKQTVAFIKSQLLKVSGIQVPPPNETKYQKGLQLAINNAAQTKQKIEKELNKIGSIKVPAPKFNNFNSALDQAVSDAKRAVRDINNALSKTKKPSSGGGGGGDGSGPGATTGPFNTNSSIQGSKADSGGGVGDTVINIHVMDETIMRRITARSGRGRFTLGA